MMMAFVAVRFPNSAQSAVFLHKAQCHRVIKFHCRVSISHQGCLCHTMSITVRGSDALFDSVSQSLLFCHARLCRPSLAEVVVSLVRGSKTWLRRVISQPISVILRQLSFLRQECADRADCDILDSSPLPIPCEHCSAYGT